MSALELPSGTIVNPLYIRAVTKHAHFWGNSFYLALHMRGQADIEVERLSSAEADDLMARIQVTIDQSLSSAGAYDQAYDAGRRDGHDDGRRDGYSAGYQEAKDAFWSYDREEYRVNEYNIGYEAGRRDGKTDGEYEGWDRGYASGKNRIREHVDQALTAVKAKVLESIMKKYPLEVSFNLQQIEMAVDWTIRMARHRLYED